MTVNKHGLSRIIPSEIRRAIRSSCGYGCVICGNAIYQYEHIDPLFCDAHFHDATKIALLCGTCHDHVTRGIWSKDRVIAARNNPLCKHNGFSSLKLEVCNGHGFIIKIGKTEFVNLTKLIVIDGTDILSLKPPEADDAPPIISAKFYDRSNQLVGQIRDNVWEGSSSAFDIETKRNRISIRSEKGKVDLVLTLISSNMLNIDKIHMQFNGITISGNSENGFVISNHQTKITTPSKPIKIQKAPFWISTRDGRISLGSDTVANLINHSGQSTQLSGHIEVENLDAFSRDEETGLIHVETQGGGKFTINFDPPHRLPQQQPNPIPRNSPCPCGSGKQYKRCHGKLS
jgi:archaellum component FlaF (FlaF/FlaG flagellin family)